MASTRVHADSAAAESARQLSAHAYTVGDHIVFAAGRFAPGTRSGDRLLTHELTHVVQAERHGGAAAVRQRFVLAASKDQGRHRREVSSPGDEAEREATLIAREVDSVPASGSASAPVAVPSAVVHRQVAGQAPAMTGSAVGAAPAIRAPSPDPFAAFGAKPDVLRFTTAFFVNEHLPTVCPQCHRDRPTPLSEEFVDRDATEPRLVAWGKESDKALHIGFSTREIQLKPEAVDIIVDDYGTGLVKRVLMTHEFAGSPTAREGGAETVRRRWPEIRVSVRNGLVGWHQEQLVGAVARTPQYANLILRPDRLAAVLASKAGKVAELGRLNAVARAGQRYGIFEINDIDDYTVYFHLTDRPLWLYEISKDGFRKHEPLITEVSRQVYDSTRWIQQVTPLLLKAAALGLSLSGSVVVILAGIAIDELAEEMQRDVEGKPKRSIEEILTSAATQILVDRLFHVLAGGRTAGAAKGAAAVPASLATKIERIAERAAPMVRAELAEAEKPLVKRALEQGTAHRVTDKARLAQGHTVEVAIESAGQRHVFRLGKDGKWCRFSSVVCGVDLGADVVAAATSPRSLTAGRIEETRSLIHTIEEEAVFLASVSRRMRTAGKMDLTLLSSEERATLDTLSEAGDAAKLTLPELNRMAKAPDLARHLEAAVEQETRLVKQLAVEGHPLYEVLRAGSPSYKSRSLVLREAGRRDAVTGLLPRSGALDVDHVVPLREILEMPSFRQLRLERQLELVNDVKNLRAIDHLANRSRGSRTWGEWSQGLLHYDAAQLARMRTVESDLRIYLSERIKALR